MNPQFQNAEYPEDRLRHSVFGILDAVTLCSIASSASDQRAHINAAYFCYTESLEFYFVSDPATQHGRNIALHPKIAVAIFDTNQPWGDSLRGLQLFGDCHLADTMEAAHALRVHAKRFRAYAEYIRALNPLDRDSSPHKFYVFIPETIKILDEAEFGEEIFVTAEIVRG